KYARQAALAAIDQEQILQADIGNEKYFRTCDAMFGCDTKYATDAGSEDLVKANPEKSKELLKKADYDGSPIVLLRPTDFPNAGGSFAPVIAQQLRQGGFEVKIQAMDWQTVIQR